MASLLALGFTTSAIANEDGKGAYVGLAYGTTAFAEGDAVGLKGLGFRASWNADIYAVDPIIGDAYTQSIRYAKRCCSIQILVNNFTNSYLTTL